MSGLNGEPKSGGIGTETNVASDPNQVPDPAVDNGADKTPATPTDKVTAEQIVCGGFQFTSTIRRAAAVQANPNPRGTFH
jgi:hypothetical protein